MMTGRLAVFESIDRWTLLRINRDWTHRSLDMLMPVVTDFGKLPWVKFGLAPALIAFWLWKGRRRALKILVVGMIAVAVSDTLAYKVIKPWAARPRPEVAHEAVIMRAPVGGTYGFPSNHAANMAAAASVLSVAYPAGAYLFWGLALVVGYSRVYVGAHYPFDVLGGLALGLAVSWPWAVLMLAEGGGSSGRKKKR